MNHFNLHSHHSTQINHSTYSVGAISNASATTALEHQQHHHHLNSGDNRDHVQHADIALGFVDIYQSLTPRQVGVIAVGSAIGTGLMIGTARALTMSGPAAMVISYTFVGFAVYLVLLALGEVAAWLPRPYTVADQAVRFVDPALGFSLGWIYWLKYAIVTPNQLTAAALVISYWIDPQWINPGIWITVFLTVITLLNFLHHRLPSQVEFYVSSFKLLVMSALMILSLVIALGGGPDHDRRGFRYWSQSGEFNTLGSHVNRTLLEKFLEICATMSSATFAFIGSERSGIMVKSPNVRKAISRAIKHTFYRVLVFHLLGITLLGMLVPRNSSALSFSGEPGKRPGRGSAASPFVAAIYLSGIAIVPDVLNGCILLFVLSIANYDLYLATKAMCDLSLKHRAPSFLLRTNRRGVPVYALGVCSIVATLAYVNVTKDSRIVFGYFVDMTTMLGILVWVSILITHIAFVRARKAQGIPEDTLTFRARFGLAGTWLALFLCLFISVTLVVGSFRFNQEGKLMFNFRAVVATYVGLPIYLILIIGYKLVMRTKRVNPKEADMWTGKLDVRLTRPGAIEIVVA
ncbi:Amino acid/polyamine transporter I [Penicillium angulare]|uniref:Amino acid/polyamine transporter I n=1 Tax=Penicillium angulare TaxID=116970 RepID=UPI00253FBC11|nr:Amino acid/polyamine transporter I [Penicillium angulare]KAJ5272500.1 Amino acid/polyamine transporter I [Penicillium angulare]